MGKEFVAERNRIERRRMQNRWFYINSVAALLGIAGWLVGGGMLVLSAFVVILGLNAATPIDSYFRLRGALARDRAKQ